MSDNRFHLSVMGEKPAPAAAPEQSLSADAPLEERIVAALRTIYDPEIPLNIHDLGLIYDLKVLPEGAVAIRMTLTSPNCPVAGSLVGEVQKKVAALAGVSEVKVDLVWDPPWDRSRLSEEAALVLGLD
jgi:FeS assembly SUF system protein